MSDRPTADRPSLAEMMRILDVAGQLRRQRETAEREFDRDAERRELRGKLAEAARVSGDPVTEAEIDAAIEQYYANLHTYRDPAMSFSVALAHLYIRRGKVLAGLVLIGGLVFGAWWLWG